MRYLGGGGGGGGWVGALRHEFTPSPMNPGLRIFGFEQFEVFNSEIVGFPRNFALSSLKFSILEHICVPAFAEDPVLGWF